MRRLVSFAKAVVDVAGWTNASRDLVCIERTPAVGRSVVPRLLAE